MMKEELLSAAEELCKIISDVIHEAKPFVLESASNFVSSHVKVLGRLIGAYNRFFKSIGVKNRKDAEKLWTKLMIHDNTVEEKLDALLDKENEFNTFLNSIDEQLKIEKDWESSPHKLEVGEKFQQNLTVRSIEEINVPLKTYFPKAGSLIIIFLRHFA